MWLPMRPKPGWISSEIKSAASLLHNGGDGFQPIWFLIRKAFVGKDRADHECGEAVAGFFQLFDSLGDVVSEYLRLGFACCLDWPITVWCFHMADVVEGGP